MKRSGLTYTDATRIGKGLLTVSMFRTWWEYASHVAFDTKDFGTFDAIKAAFTADRDPKSWTPVRLTEEAANRLLDAIKRRGGRPNTALELDTAIKRAKRRPETTGQKPKVDPEAKAAAERKSAFVLMFEAGELSEDEIAAGRRKGLL